MPAIDVAMRILVLAFVLFSPKSLVSAGAPSLDGDNIHRRQDGDSQSSLTLDSSQVMSALQQSGLNTSDPSITASLTSNNNFINWCLTQNVPLTNGTQQSGAASCNPVPMGRVLASDKIPSSKFKYPKNGSLLSANTTFTVELVVRNFDTGHFSNSATNWLAAPQSVNDSGELMGHSHIVIEPVSSYLSEDPMDPLQFIFFKAMNPAAVNNVLSVTVTGGVPPGVYRISSLNSAINHQPPLVSVASRGASDDIVYFRAASFGLNKRGIDEESPFV